MKNVFDFLRHLWRSKLDGAVVILFSIAVVVPFIRGANTFWIWWACECVALPLLGFNVIRSQRRRAILKKEKEHLDFFEHEVTRLDQKLIRKIFSGEIGLGVIAHGDEPFRDDAPRLIEEMCNARRKYIRELNESRKRLVALGILTEKEAEEAK